MSKEVTSTLATYTTTWNKKNAKSMIETYQQKLDATPFWRIFKRRQLKVSIKLWTKIKEQSK
jgi:hypothetical protein